tara:strand:+ start:14448 stop:15272 length:825 start_codon:yes stop_codon:yes gene_type:complete
VEYAGMTLEATFYYANPQVKTPAYFLCPPPPDAERRAPGRIGFTCAVEDVRERMHELDLDREGLAFLTAQPPQIDYYDNEQIVSQYYPEAVAWVRAATGAREVVAFDHNVRNKARAGDEQLQARAPVQNPVKSVHNDYTEQSGPQRFADLLPNRTTERFSIINVWRPLEGPVRQTPFAVIAAASMDSADLVRTELVYTDRVGEIYMVRHNPTHRWMYVSNMQANEVMLLKCYDSATAGIARYTAHSAFELPMSDAERAILPARQSIEVRTLVTY